MLLNVKSSFSQERRSGEVKIGEVVPIELSWSYLYRLYNTGSGARLLRRNALAECSCLCSCTNQQPTGVVGLSPTKVSIFLLDHLNVKLGN